MSCSPRTPRSWVIGAGAVGPQGVRVFCVACPLVSVVSRSRRLPRAPRESEFNNRTWERTDRSLRKLTVTEEWGSSARGSRRLGLVYTPKLSGLGAATLGYRQIRRA